MFVGALKLDLQILGSRSLKEKRMVLRRIKDRVRERLGLIVAEVGAQELWQRALLGVAAVSGDRGKVMELLDGAWRCIAATEGIELLGRWREVTSFEGQPVAEQLPEGLAGELPAGDRSSERPASERPDGRSAEPSEERPSGQPAGGEGGASARPRSAGRTPWTPPEWQRMLDEESR